MDGPSNTPVREIKDEGSNMDITVEDRQLLISMLSAYKLFVRTGKFLGYAFVGLLGFIVLASQAWDAVRGWFIK